MEAEQASLRTGVLQLDRYVQQFAQLPGDSQAQPLAGDGIGLSAAAVEPPENAFPVLQWNAAALVPDQDDGAVGGVFQLHSRTAVGAGVFDGVFSQNHYQLPQAVVVGQHLVLNRVRAGKIQGKMDAYQEFFAGKTIDEIEAWFASSCSDANGRPLKITDKSSDEDKAKYDALNEDQQAALVDLTTSATMSLQDAHGDILTALAKSCENVRATA